MTLLESWIDRAAGWMMGHRWVPLSVLVLLLAASLGVVWGKGLKADFSPQALFTSFEDQQAVDRAFAAHFGKTENVALWMVEADDVLTVEVLQYIHDVALWLREQPFARRVESLTTTPLPRGGADALEVTPVVSGDRVTEAHRQALVDSVQHSTVIGQSLLSDSRRLAVIAVFLNDGYEAISLLTPVVDQLRNEAATRPLPPGVRAQVGGIPNMRAYVVRTMLGDQKKLVPLAMLISSILLFLTFRWFPGLFLPMGAVGVTVIYVLGGMALVEEPFNILNQMVPTMLIIIGTSDAIHLISRYREEARRGHDRFEAARRTMTAMAMACFLTSFTTAVGFGSLVISRTDILRRFGVTAAIGVVIAYVVTVVLVPTLLSWLKAPPDTDGDPRRQKLEAFCGAIAAWVLPRRVRVLAASAVVFGLVGWGATRMVIDTHLLETFPVGTEVHSQVTLLQAELDGVLPYEVSITSRTQGRFDDPEFLNRVWAIEVWLRQQHGALSVTSYPDLLYDLWVAWTGDPSVRGRPFASEAQVAQLASLLEDARGGPLDPWVTFDRRHLRIGVKLADLGSRHGLELSEQVLAHIRAEFAGLEDVEVALTGDAYSGSLGLTALVGDMLGSLFSAFLLIFGFMALLFRSLRMGLISVPPNILPLLATMSWMAFRGIHLNTSTVITFSVALGLAVDDTIHMLARFREEQRAGATVDKAILASARGSGRAILITSIMLGAGLSVLLWSSFVPIRLFAELLGVTIANCLVADLVILPALLKVFWPELAPSKPPS
jgi:predicted RND superfamily exporter protein